MGQYLEILLALPVLIICYQMYSFAAKRSGAEMQKSCRLLGIIYMAIGITLLILREPVFVFTGLILMMFGFRLIAKGLDRLDKTIFIDRYNDHEDNKGD